MLIPLSIICHSQRFGRRDVDMDDEDYGRRRAAAMSNHQPTRPVDKEKNEAELGVSIKKAVTAEETAPSKSIERDHIFVTSK